MKDNEIVIDAMKMIIAHRPMYEFCMEHIGQCVKCPFFKNKVCTKKSTIDVLSHAAEIFEEFLNET